MTYQRITADIRDRIISRLREQFTPRFEELDKLENRLAETIYEEMHGPHAVLMASLPEGWLPTSSSITVNAKKNGEFYESFRFTHPKRFTAANHSNYTNVSPELLKICKQFREDKKDLKAERDSTLNEARRVIESVTTLNKLIEVWPEIASVIKDIGEEPNPTRQVPAKVLDQLNEKLDLPVEERKAA